MKAQHGAFSVRCDCGTVYNTDDSHLGKQLQCRCGRRVSIVRPSVAQSDTATERTSKRTRRTKSDGSHSRGGSSVRDALAWMPSVRLPALGEWPERARDTVRQWVSDSVSDMRSRRAARRWVSRCAWLWFAVAVTAWLLLITTSEVFVPSTLLAYGPRYFLLVPSVLLAFAAGAVARRSLVPLALAFMLIVGPIMGFRLSTRTFGTTIPLSAPPGALRVVSYNALNGQAVSTNVRNALASLHPDLVAFQECGELLWDTLQVLPEWHRVRVAGMCSLSRWPIIRVDSMPRADITRAAALGYGGAGSVSRITVDSPHGRMDFVSVHLETARKGLFAFLGTNKVLLEKLGVEAMKSRRVLNAKGNAEQRFEAQCVCA